MRQALRPITPRACANDAESAIFEIHFYQERKLWKKRSLVLWSGLEPGSDALQTTAFATEPMGLWQLWTSNFALILLTAVYAKAGLWTGLDYGLDSGLDSGLNVF